MSSLTEVSEVHVYSEYDYEIFNTEEFLKCESSIGQSMIVDSGCPRGLMGYREYEKIKLKYETETIKLCRKEMFGFGPSKSYSSEYKVTHARQKYSYIVGLKALQLSFFMEYE